MIAWKALGKLVLLAKRLSLDLICFDTVVTSDIKNFEKDPSFTLSTEPKVPSVYVYLEQNPSFRLEVCWYLIKTSFCKEHNLHFGQNEYNRDVIFTLNTFEKARSVVHVPIPLHCYFQSEVSIMRHKNLEHCRILIDNLHAMIQDFISFISRLETKKIPNKEIIIQNLENRRNTFLVFFLTKLIRSDLNAEQAKVYLKQLKEIEAYPVQ